VIRINLWLKKGNDGFEYGRYLWPMNFVSSGPSYKFAFMTSLKNKFLSEVNTELAKYPKLPVDVFLEEDIVHLPPPVQRYFEYCGYLSRQKSFNARIDWEEVFLKMGPGKKWMHLDCYQFNAVLTPARIVYMKSRIAGFFPFEGRDKYQDGHGSMQIELLNLWRVSDVKGPEMDESALVTLLAEALLVPGYALQPYIRWEPIDACQARATISHNGTEVSGIFYFDAQGAFLRFETNDRNWTLKDGSFKKIRWSGIVDAYRIVDGLRLPASFRAVWHTPSGDYEYFRGKIMRVEYNIQTYYFTQNKKHLPV
jgi:hypothetical protein